MMLLAVLTGSCDSFTKVIGGFPLVGKSTVPTHENCLTLARRALG